MKRWIVSVLTGILAVLSFSGCMMGDNYYGKGYETIEKAWDAGRIMEYEDDDYDIAQEIARLQFVGGTKWLYISKGGYFVEVDLVYENESWWTKSYGSHEIAELKEWYEFIQEEGYENDLYHILPGTNILIGSRLHDGKTVCVNGVDATTETYTIAYEDVICVLDYWYLANFNSDDYDSIVITYKGE